MSSRKSSSNYSLPHHKTKKTQGVNLESLYKWWPLCESNTAPTDYESTLLRHYAYHYATIHVLKLRYATK